MRREQSCSTLPIAGNWFGQEAMAGAAAGKSRTRDGARTSQRAARSSLDSRIIGKSVEGRAIRMIGPPDVRGGVLLLGGVHGDEPKSVDLLRRFVMEWSEDPARFAALAVVPLVNPDGFERRVRRNANGVDLNRNFPARNWEPGKARSRMYGGVRPQSEPETRAIVRLIARLKPQLIVAVHSINRQRFCVNYDGPGEEIARLVARHNGYPVTSTIGYPTPGSLGSYAGIDLKTATITLELPSHHSSARCWHDNLGALTAASLT